MAGTAYRDEPQWTNLWQLGFRESAPGPEIWRGAEVGQVSRDRDPDGGTTAFLRLPPGWRHVERAADATVELFVLEGAIDVGGETLGVSGFAGIALGSGPLELASPRGALVLCYHTPGLTTEHAYPDGLRLLRTWQEGWTPYEVPGLRHGSVYKGLRTPDVTTGPLHGGPKGMLRLHLLTPGFTSPQEEIHEDCWEEIVCLGGDFLMPKRGMSGPGTLLVNPAGYPHGPYFTQGSAFLLVHSASPMPTSYTDYPCGPEIGAHYLETVPLVREPRTDRWDDRPEKAVWEQMVSERAAAAV